MSCDRLVYDIAQEVEGTPNIFIKKDWLNILDNQNGNYSANQCVVDSSQLCNSNKYLNYREGYLSVPMLLTLSCPTAGAPATAATSLDYAIGLKNWFGSVIHSLTLDYNGTTIIQQTPFVNMWNSFKLMTTLSMNDVATMGSTIGFYPDDPLSWSYCETASVDGQGVCNNTNYTEGFGVIVDGVFNSYKSNNGNVGLLKRQTYINYDTAADSGEFTYAAQLAAPNNIWKSYVSKKQNYAAGPPVVPALYQVSVRATIYLKHLHSFFQMVPLLKGVYMKMTLNLNNASTSITVAGGGAVSLTSVNVPVGGVNPLMIASKMTSNGSAAGLVAGVWTASLSVGAQCLEPSQANLSGISQGQVGNNIFLYVPAYTFNPPFEQAYLSSPIKNIAYTDIYQYQVLNTPANGNINALLTNGLANIKSVLILPFYTSITPTIPQPVYQSPFDPAGTGPTSPLCHLTNFNVVVSGQNAIYNTQRYAYEQFNNQLYGVNAVNGGMTDGLTSGLIDSLGFDMEYCYYYVDVSRMLPVEESVPKSVQVVGQNASAKAINLWCFIEYGTNVSIDVLTGARV